MPRHWILPSKLAVPQPPAHWLPRECWPAEQPLPPVVLLVAGHGYGKTLAMLALSARSDHETLVWLSLDAEDADPTRFFYYMIEGLRPHVPPLAEELETRMAAGDATPEQLWRHLFGAAIAYNLPGMTLVLDDLHHLLTTEVAAGLWRALDHLPPTLRLLVSTRERPSWPLARSRARGRIGVLGAEQLRFSAEEEETFLQARAGGPVPARWRERCAELEGWPLGIELATALDTTAEWRGGDSDAIAEYVAEELFATQPAELRALLLDAAMLQTIEARALEDIFGHADVERGLAALENSQVLQRLANGDGYRMPAYWRRCLEREAQRAHTRQELAGRHRRAAAYYAVRDRHEHALPHHLAAEDWPGAIAAAEVCFAAMRHDGRHDAIARRLAAFPAAQRESAPCLLIWQGHLASRAGRHAEAGALYQRARQAFADACDGAGEFQALVRLCNHALLTQDQVAFPRLLLQAQACQENGRPEDRADLLLIRALAADQHGDAALMRECNEAVLDVPVAGNPEIAASHCVAAINLLTAALHHGELGRAERAAQEAINLADAHGFSSYAVTARALQAHLKLLTGDLDGAEALLTALPEGWPEWMSWNTLALALTVQGHYLQARGDWRAAEETLQRALGIFERAGFAEGTKVPLERLTWLALQRKQPERAVALVPTTIDPRNIYDAALLLPQARALHLLGRPAEALASLETAIAAFDSLDARLYATRARLFAAATRMRLGDRAGAEQAWRSACDAIAREGYAFLRTQDRALWDELAALETDEAPPSTLALRCFGTFEVRLDGVVLDEWPRRKTRLLLACLALHPRGLDQLALAEALGAREATPAALATLRSDVSTLRRALEPELGRYQASRFVQSADEHYRLSAEALAGCDLREFEAAMQQAESLAADPETACEHYRAALALYRGNLLDEGVFARHFEAEREAYRRQALRAIDALAAYERSRGAHAAEENWLRRAIAIAPHAEERYLALMRFYHGLDLPERIRQTYWDCRKALKAGVGRAPEAEFEAAYRAMRVG